MTQSELIKDIQSKKIAPVYLLHGEEDYYIDKISEFLEDELLTEEEKSFNLSVFYGRDGNVQGIIDAARRFPMFAEKQIVEIREANQLKGIEGLEQYLLHIVPSTVLIICHKGGSLDKRKKIYKLIQDKGIVFDSVHPKENEIPAFIDKYLKKKNVSIDNKANHQLVDYLGRSLSKIVNELDKLILNVKAGSVISSKEIEEHIGISREHNVWELQSAMLVKNSAKVFSILHVLNQNLKLNPPVLTISTLHSAFVKLYLFQNGPEVKDWDLFKLYGIHSSQVQEFRTAKSLYPKKDVERIFSLFLEYDLRSKGLHNVNTPVEELLKEMVYRIMFE